MVSPKNGLETKSQILKLPSRPDKKMKFQLECVRMNFDERQLRRDCPMNFNEHPGAVE